MIFENLAADTKSAPFSSRLAEEADQLLHETVDTIKGNRLLQIGVGVAALAVAGVAYSKGASLVSNVLGKRALSMAVDENSILNVFGREADLVHSSQGTAFVTDQNLSLYTGFSQTESYPMVVTARHVAESQTAGLRTTLGDGIDGSVLWVSAHATADVALGGLTRGAENLSGRFSLSTELPTTGERGVAIGAKNRVLQYDAGRFAGNTIDSNYSKGADALMAGVNKAFNSITKLSEKLAPSAENTERLADQSWINCRNGRPHFLDETSVLAKLSHVRPGWSGGPLLNAETGAVVGVTESRGLFNNTMFAPAQKITELVDLTRRYLAPDALWNSIDATATALGRSEQDVKALIWDGQLDALRMPGIRNEWETKILWDKAGLEKLNKLGVAPEAIEWSERRWLPNLGNVHLEESDLTLPW